MSSEDLKEKEIIEDDRQPVDTDYFFTIPNILSLLRIFLIPFFSAVSPTVCSPARISACTASLYCSIAWTIWMLNS